MILIRQIYIVQLWSCSLLELNRANSSALNLSLNRAFQSRLSCLFHVSFNSLTPSQQEVEMAVYSKFWWALICTQRTINTVFPNKYCTSITVLQWFVYLFSDGVFCYFYGTNRRIKLEDSTEMNKCRLSSPV